MTLSEIVEQLEKCKYECEAGSLSMNTAFIELKEKAKLSNQLEIALKTIAKGFEQLDDIENAPVKSKWQQRLEEMQKAQQERLNNQTK